MNFISTSTSVACALVAQALILADVQPGAPALVCDAFCERNPGSGDGWIYVVHNFCPIGCNIKKLHAGSSCYLAGWGQPGSEVWCEQSYVQKPWYFTHTTTCQDNQCDFRNSFWSESRDTTQTPTCSTFGPCGPWVGGDQEAEGPQCTSS